MSGEKTTVLGNFSFTLPAPNGASVALSGYVYAGESAESLNERMDLCREALMRQQALLELPVLKEAMEKAERTLNDARKAYANLLERKEAKSKLSSQDQAHLTNFPTTIKYYEDEVKKGREKIASLEKAA